MAVTISVGSLSGWRSLEWDMPASVADMSSADRAAILLNISGSPASVVVWEKK